MKEVVAACAWVGAWMYLYWVVWMDAEWCLALGLVFAGLVYKLMGMDKR